MHKAGVLVVVAWTFLAGPALAQDIAQSAPEEAGRVDVGTSRKMDGGATFLLMPLGRGNGYWDLALAYGVGVSLGYRVFYGLSVGLAPQVLFNIKRAEDPRKQYDLMARIAYTFRAANRISIYGEVLPGYSIISPRKGDSAQGFVVAAGAGGAIDVMDRAFVNASVGYQWGFQSLSIDGTPYSERDSFLRVALGGGMRF
jgi:hypothetical protein